MTTPNIYVPYPVPQTMQQLVDDINAIITQPGVNTDVANLVFKAEDSPQTQIDINESEANSDSTADE
jgi:hypothetical protein